MIKMDLSLLQDEAMMDDSFLVIRPEAMDDEVTQIFKKWKLNNPLPPTLKKDIIENANSVNQNQTFDSRTFTRPAKRRTFNILNNSNLSSTTTSNSESEMQSMESGIASINLQIGGPYTPMQKSWLNDVSPPSSICTSMDFQNNDNMLNSLITSSDFTNVSFLLNTSVHENMNMNGMPKQRLNSTVTVNNNVNNATVTVVPSGTRNLMEFTFDVDKTITNQCPSSNTFVTDSEPPMKEFGIENADIQLNMSTEDIGKNLTFNKYECNNITWDKIQDHQLNSTVVQSTPVHSSEILSKNHLKKDFEDDTISPISSFHAQLIEDDDGGEIILRSVKGKKLLDVMDDYRNSMEDQCEFLLNEETIKLSTRVCGGSSETYECLDDIKNEKEFDEMLDSFNVKKSMESEKLLQSVDNIKQRHSLINMEKQREEKQKRDSENDNRLQYDIMNKSNERLLNRRSRLFDDVNLQLQKQQLIETSTTAAVNRSASPNNNKNRIPETAVNDAENDETVDKNDRDRFKTIKLNRPRLQTGMVVIDAETDSVETEVIESANGGSNNEISPGTNKERQNQLNQQKQEENGIEVKKPPAAVSKLSKFGFTRPMYNKPRNDLNLPLKANSTDSLDNDTESSSSKQPVSNLKSPMGIKSKSIHNLMFNGAQNGLRMSSNLKYNFETTKSQSNLKAPRASSLVRPSVESNFKIPQANQPRPIVRKPAVLVRPSSGYYGRQDTYTKRFDSDNDNESTCSLSSSSASSRNSVHLSLASDQQQFYQHSSLQSTEDLNQPMHQKTKGSGAVPKSSGISRPIMMSGLPRPQGKNMSGLPRPRR